MGQFGRQKGFPPSAGRYPVFVSAFPEIFRMWFKKHGVTEVFAFCSSVEKPGETSRRINLDLSHHGFRWDIFRPARVTVGRTVSVFPAQRQSLILICRVIY
jgi:hypothetical protein